MTVPRIFCQRPKPGARVRLIAFTLVELLVSMAVLLLVMVVLFQLTAGVGNLWKSSSGKISGFQSARSAFSTLNQTLARATVNTYNDYVNASGSYRTSSNSATFVPTKFNRASELHFIAGPAAAIVPGSPQNAFNPGSAVFFQAPLGVTTQSDMSGLNRTMNSIAFYVQYGKPDAGLLPPWLSTFAGSSGKYRFLLVEYVEPADGLQVYNSTSKSSYDLGWLNFCSTPAIPGQPRMRVLAEDVLLLVMRPRLSPSDEKSVAAGILNTGYDPATQLGSLLSPDYLYDSRAWQKNSPSPSPRDNLMRNQVPPIIDVAMVCADPQSLARFDSTSGTPPAQVLVPSTLFTDSSQMEADLAAYALQLTKANIRFHILRSSVEIQGAKWSNN